MKSQVTTPRFVLNVLALVENNLEPSKRKESEKRSCVHVCVCVCVRAPKLQETHDAGDSNNM